MSRRSPGEGSITKRKDGRWQGSSQVGGVRRTVCGRTRTEVIERLRSFQEEVRKNNRLAQPGSLTLGEYLTEWLQQTKMDLMPHSVECYRRVIENHVGSLLGKTPLKKLNPLQLARFESTIEATRTRQLVHRVLHKALADAARWGLLANNPLDSVDCPRYRPREKPLWTAQQVSSFVQATQEGKGGHYGDLFLFLLASGCRLGEALGLRWNDIDFKTGTVRIERQLTEVNGRHIEQAPKTKAGIRTITLPGFGVEALKRRKERAPSVRVFTTEVGTAPLKGNIRRSFHAICKRLGLPRIRVHDLRHLHLSLLAMGGVPLKVAQQRAGHSTPAITMQVYTHVLGDGDRLAAEALDKALRGGGVV